MSPDPKDEGYQKHPADQALLNEQESRVLRQLAGLGQTGWTPGLAAAHPASEVVKSLMMKLQFESEAQLRDFAMQLDRG